MSDAPLYTAAAIRALLDEAGILVRVAHGRRLNGIEGLPAQSDRELALLEDQDPVEFRNPRVQQANADVKAVAEAIVAFRTATAELLVRMDLRESKDLRGD